MSESVLEKIFGPEFVERYRKSLAKAQEIPREKLSAIRSFAVEALKASEDFHVKYDNLDVILVQTPRDLTKFPVVRTSAGNWKVGMIWPGSKSLRGPFISVFTALREDADKLASRPEKLWLLVGKLQERTFEGDVTYSFRCQGIIDLEEG